MFDLNYNSKDFIDSADLLLKVLGVIGAGVAFHVGYNRYKKDQNWKRKEFIANEIKDFNSEPMVRNTMFMLDWSTRKIELFPNKESYAERYVKVDRDILNVALLHHFLKIKNPGEDRFNETEIAIRDNFDYFLISLGKFNEFMQAGLITTEEIEPYLNYWITTISEGLEDPTRNILFNYIDKYEFKSVQELFNNFGKDIEPKVFQQKDIPGSN